MCVKISKSTREKPKVPVKILKKFLTWKSDFYTWIKKQKLHAWKPKSGREKSGESRWMYLFLQTFFNFVTIFFGIHRFLYYWSEILCVKIKTFAWKNSFLLAWKLKANTWNLKKKSTWKNQTVREISEKSIREKRLPHVKKMIKWQKKNVSRIFFSRRKKKTLTAMVVTRLVPSDPIHSEDWERLGHRMCKTRHF